MARCPAHGDRTPSLAVTDRDGRVLVHCHAGCEQRDVIEALRRRGLWLGRSGRAEQTGRPALPSRHEPDTRVIAAYLWRRRHPVQESPVERYLCDVRRYRGPIPSTLGYLPPHGDHPPAMIAAFGLADEPKPGMVTIADEAVTAVHLTRLTADGRKAGPPTKIMLGAPIVGPIVIAHPGDGLGLAVTEGIEDALAVHEATGLGTWAAGSAGRLPAMAEHIPAFIEAVTIPSHDDPAGRRAAAELAALLRARGVEVIEAIPWGAP